MIVQPLRIGLIVPSSNTVMEPEFHRHLGEDSIVSTARILLEDVTREAEFQMLGDHLANAIVEIGTTAPDLVVFGCTSAGALGTLAHDEAIAARIAKGTKARALTVLGAVLAELRRIGARKIAVFTPYIEELTNGIAASLNEAGFQVVQAVGMGIRANLEIARVTPGEIVSFVESNIGDCAPDCVFLSCTNWQAMDAIETLRKKLGKPVLSSNQAAIDAVRYANRVPAVAGN